MILLLGAALRVYKIGKESFWIDEGLEATVYTKYNGLEIFKNIWNLGQMLPGYYPGISDLPLYEFSLEYWTHLWGISETSLRLYSALYGILSIIFVFLIARHLYGIKSAYLSAFLFSISIPAIHYSQEARPYSLYLFLSVASIYYFINSLKSNRNYHWGMYILFTMLGLYTHYLFEILLIFQLLYLIFYLITIERYSIKSMISKLIKNKRSMIRKIVAVYFIMAIIASPLILKTFRKDNMEEWRKTPTMENAARMFVNFSSWIYPGDELRQKIKSPHFYNINVMELLLIISFILVVMLSYLLIACFIYSKIKKVKFRNFIIEEKSTVFLLGWFAFPPLLSFVLSRATPIPIFGPIHYLLYCLPPFVMLLSESMLRFKLRHFRLLLAFFVIISILPLNAYYSNTHKQQWREAAEYLKEKLQGNEIVLTSLSSGAVSLKYYYNIDANNIYGVAPDTKMKKPEKTLYLKDAKEMLKDQERFWFVLSFWKYEDPQGSIQSYINQDYEAIETKSFFDIEVYHMQKRKNAGN